MVTGRGSVEGDWIKPTVKVWNNRGGEKNGGFREMERMKRKLVEPFFYTCTKRVRRSIGCFGSKNSFVLNTDVLREARFMSSLKWMSWLKKSREHMRTTTFSNTRQCRHFLEHPKQMCGDRGFTYNSIDLSKIEQILFFLQKFLLFKQPWSPSSGSKKKLWLRG